LSGDGLEKNVVIENQYGLHARPAAMFVSTCNRFKSEIRVVKDKTTVNGKNILEIMTLGAGCGTQLTLKVQGPDAEDAMAALVELFVTKFGE